MDKSEKDFIRNNALNSFNFDNLGTYSFFFAILILILMLGIYLKKRISSYMYRRRKLIDSAEDYERKRNSRNDLKVILIIIFSIIIIGQLTEEKLPKLKISEEK